MILPSRVVRALNEFGKHYVRPIENEDGRDTERLESLRALIEPQTLRRTKEEVARDLPQKIEVESCKQLTLSGVQNSSTFRPLQIGNNSKH